MNFLVKITKKYNQIKDYVQISAYIGKAHETLKDGNESEAIKLAKSAKILENRYNKKYKNEKKH